MPKQDLLDRLEVLEQKAFPDEASGVDIVIYRAINPDVESGEISEGVNQATNGRATIYLPDNGRGDNAAPVVTLRRDPVEPTSI